jgi:hypothetical protein
LQQEIVYTVDRGDNQCGSPPAIEKKGKKGQRVADSEWRWKWEVGSGATKFDLDNLTKSNVLTVGFEPEVSSRLVESTSVADLRLSSANVGQIGVTESN